MDYVFDKQLANETHIRIETNNRDFFIGLEEVINDFITDFTNENELFDENELIGFEKSEIDENENELTELVKNENRFQKFDGNENENTSVEIFGNEPHYIKFKRDKNISEVFLSKEPTINTPWGLANVGGHGYYAITTSIEGNCGKLLHRLIYEDYHKCTLLKQGIVHHKDGNRLNNSIENLELISRAEHNQVHKIKNRESYINMEEYWEITNKQSQEKNTVGYLRVSKAKNPKLKQGFAYQYQWRENGKRNNISAVNLKDLESKVKAKGLPWRKL